MRKTYGNTWWGQQFLQALQRIDFSNRLPRGRTYANKGAVLEIKTKKGLVKAKVQGSRANPYKQEIGLAPFSKQQRQKIVQTVVDNPYLLSQLLNRELPPELNQELERLDLQLFPQSWDDVDAECSCPDWAVPCKHLAAVIYVLANEVDKSPFLVFELRGLNLMKALEQGGFTRSETLGTQLPEWSQFLRELPDSSSSTSLEATLAGLDFSRIPDCREKLLRLLRPNPVFYPAKDFHLLLDQWYAKVSRLAGKYEPQLQAPPLPYDLEGFTFELNDHLQLAQIQERSGSNIRRIKAPDLEILLASLTKTEEGHGTEVIPYLQALWQFTRHLLMSSAVMPQLIALPTKGSRLRWIPATLDQTVQKQVRQFANGWPRSLAIYQRGSKSMGYFDKAEQVRWLVALMVEAVLLQEISIETPDPISRLFFRGFHFKGLEFGEEETPFAIQQWLQRFSLSERDFMPVLKVEEAEPDFLLSFWVEDKHEPLAPLIPLADIFEKTHSVRRRMRILQDLASLEEFLPQVRDAISSKGKHEIFLDSESFVQVLSETLPALDLIGIRILLPKSLQRIARPQVSLELTEFGNPNAAESYLDLADMLQFRWQVAVGDLFLDPKDFLDQVQQMRGLIKIQDTYVLVDDKEMKALLKKLQDPPKMDAAALLQAGLTETYEDGPVNLSPEVRQLIQELLTQESVPVPDAVQATLRPYQDRGYEWLYKNDRIGFGSILADDMGLGKTLQVITFLARLQEAGELKKKKALIVVPTTLLTNWQREIDKFAPELRAGIFHGPGRKLDTKAVEVVLTSYGVARSDSALLNRRTWRVLVIDEAQAIKNPGTAQSKALKKLKADTRIAMSGTPVENRLSEYWSIFDFANKGYLPNLNKFKKQFIEPIEKDRDQEKLQQFLTITSPFILRRLKTDKSIISDLPDKIEQDQICQLTVEQTALYQGVVENNLQEIAENEGIARAGMIFKLMTALKQICNHPSHFLKKGKSDPSLSGKAQYLMELLEQIREQGEKVLIFTQYREMGDLLVQMMQERFPEEPLFLHGGLSRKKRDEMVVNFQEKPYAWAFILSLKAGGTGLNLTAANHVVHYDLWWNPAVEAQATDRAFRIGQQKNVLVNRLITQGTFEEKINEMIRKKRELASLTVQTGEQWIGELSHEELKGIFALG